MQELNAAIAEIRADLIALRRAIHRYPEPGFEETETQARIRRELAAMGIEARACAGTGLVADIGQNPSAGSRGRTIALRADIDCLRMTEENPDLPYRSERDGLAHMCGHDGHTAMLTGAARLLAQVREHLPGTVRLLFQPAEEGPGGAPVMIRDGALDAVDEVYGLHNWPLTPLGELLVIAGPCMARVCTFTVKVTGTGGHASQPQEAVDPVLTAAHIVTALQSIVSRNLHYGKSNVVSVTMIHGGEIHNVIPDSVTLTGSIRALDDSDYELIEARIRTIADQTAAAFGARAECHFDSMYPVLVNHAREAEHVARVGRAVFGDDHVSSNGLPMLGAEDFAFFTQERPGCYFFLGGAEPGRSNAMCHATNYDFNDNLVEKGVAMWIRLVEDRLGIQLYG